MFRILQILGILTILFFGGCKEKDTKSPVKIHWDRDMCQRCKMVVSDRKNSAEVRDVKSGKTYMFDDIGCAILWFKQETDLKEQDCMVYITDVNTGEFIDAKSAYYTTDNITPMAYGFSAHQTKNTIGSNQEVVDWAEVKKRVIKIGK